MPDAKADMIDEVKKFVKDILSIDVVTMTGKLDITVAEVTDGGKIDFVKLHTSIVGKLDGNVKIAAFSHVGLDSDTVQFVMETTTDADTAVIEHHRATLKHVQDARAAFLESIKIIVT